MSEFKELKIEIGVNEQELIDYQNYLIKLVSQVYGIPPCYFEGYKETLWQKVKRKAKLLVWKIGEKVKRKKKKTNFTKEFSKEAFIQMEINQALKNKNRI